MSSYTGIKSRVRLWRALILRRMAKCAPLKSIDLSQRALIVAPHPDDETFGVGGLVALMARNARQRGALLDVDVLFLTSGGRSHVGCCDIETRDLEARREAIAISASRMLGVEERRIHFFRLVDGGLPHPGGAGFPEVANRITEFLLILKPNFVFVTHPLEGWSDHEAAAHLVRSAIGSIPDSRPCSRKGDTARPKLYHYCVWFWFSMPLSKVLMVKWRQAVTIQLNRPVSAGKMSEPSRTAHQAKLEAMKIYLQDCCPCGKPTCGVLPIELLRALEWDHELFFEVG